jgi:methanogenic corrinoid protein MtbC1
MIKKIKSSPEVSSDLKIIVGGYPFKVAEGLWKNIGADGFAPNADEAVQLADRLTAA